MKKCKPTSLLLPFHRKKTGMDELKEECDFAYNCLKGHMATIQFLTHMLYDCERLNQKRADMIKNSLNSLTTQAMTEVRTLADAFGLMPLEQEPEQSGGSNNGA